MIAQAVPPYSAFAQVYDQLMSHVPMKTWVAYLRAHAGTRERLVDLACGTGELLKTILATCTLPATGVDSSAPMLALARLKLAGLADIKKGSLTSVPLKANFTDWAVCTHDSVNYLVDPDSLILHFREVERILRPGGLYSFDAVTRENMVQEFDGKIREELVNDVYLHWTNYYDEADETLTSHLTFQNGMKTEVETHTQKFYSAEEIQDLVRKAGLDVGSPEGDYKQRKLKSGDAFMNFHCRKPL
ncbi:MAG: class I SAM-dependent methyltransferase [Spirochaetia bacterium]|nr:class I SAM-dependent methyltransferase [Spirochaetia bacterium]